MRKTYLLFLFAPAGLVWACGGSGDDNLTGDGGNDATTNDGSPQNDSATNDGASNDSAANDASDGSVINDAGTDVKLELDCLAPSDCDAGDVCCGDLTLTGTQQNCKISSATTSCKTSQACPTNVTGQVTCTGTDQVRLCTQNTDCTEVNNNKCCTFKQGDAGVSFCLNQQEANLGGGTCLQ